MARARRFGPLLYGTLALACLILLVTYGTLEFRSHIESALRFRALNRQWRDPSLPMAARGKAADQLMEFGDGAVPAYLAAVADPNGRVRAMAYRYLTSVRPISREAISACLTALEKDPDPQARTAAVWSLASVAESSGNGPGGHRRVIAEALLAAGHDPSPIVRVAVMQAMVDPRAVSADPGPWLEDPDRSVRLAAAEAILRLDPANPGRIVPILRAMIVEADPAHVDRMDGPLALLHEADPRACKEFVPTLLSHLRSQDRDVRRNALRWLGNLRAEARGAIPTLESLLDRTDPDERFRVAMALLSIDPDRCDHTIANLFAMLRDVRIPPRERTWAFFPLRTLAHGPDVPARIRAEVLRQLRAMREEPDVPPAVDAGILQLLREYREAERLREYEKAIRTSRLNRK